MFVSAAAIVLVGVADYATGNQIRIATFYLVPILWVTWTLGRRGGVALSMLSAASWLLCDLLVRDRSAHPFLPYWNGLVTFSIFLVAVFLLSAFEKERRFARACPLTRLLNRQGFFEEAELELERCRRYGRALTVGFLDGDGFKRVNDRRGHREGDRLLTRAGEVLRTQLRESDLAARLGGDEFAVLLPEAGPEAARQAFSKIGEALEAAMREGGWGVTFSAGVVTYLVPPASTDELLRGADELMYAVKRRQKGGIEYEVRGAPAGPALPG